MIKDAKAVWLDIALQDNEPIPEPEEDQDFSGKFVVRVPKTLHKDLVLRSRKENVSLNALSNYFLSTGMGKKGKL